MFFNEEKSTTDLTFATLEWTTQIPVAQLDASYRYVVMILDEITPLDNTKNQIKLTNFLQSKPLEEPSIKQIEKFNEKNLD